MAREPDEPERPRVEPEIIPPGGSPHQPFWHPSMTMRRDGSRVYTARLGPVTGAFLLLLVLVLIVAILFTVLGVVLIWVPIIVLFGIAAAIVRFLR